MYSIAYNLKAIFQRIHTFDAKLLVTLLLEVVLSVLFPLLVNVFPAFLLWCAAQSSYAQAFTMLGICLSTASLFLWQFSLERIQCGTFDRFALYLQFRHDGTGFAHGIQRPGKS